MGEEDDFTEGDAPGVGVAAGAPLGGEIAFPPLVDADDADALDSAAPFTELARAFSGEQGDPGAFPFEPDSVGGVFPSEIVACAQLADGI